MENGPSLYHKVNRLERELEALRSNILPLPEGMKPVRKGYVAELLVKYLLARQGLEYFDPPPSSEACDILVFNGKNYLRCEIKASTLDAVGIKRTLYKDGNSHKIEKYTAEDQVDFFILVQLTLQQVFIVPASYVTTASRQLISVTPKSDAWQFKDRFDLLMPV